MQPLTQHLISLPDACAVSTIFKILSVSALAVVKATMLELQLEIFSIPLILINTVPDEYPVNDLITVPPETVQPESAWAKNPIVIVKREMANRLMINFFFAFFMIFPFL
jgi:hypothetical protein